MDEIKIIEPIKTGLNHFKTTDEFNIYYNKHKKELNEMTTQKLNKQYKIEGYRITKIGTRDENGKRQNGCICLKKVNSSKIINHSDNSEMRNIDARIDAIEGKLHELATSINSIINALNGG